MIIKHTEMTIEVRANMRGGNGEITMTHLVPGKDIPHGRLLSDVIIPPGAGIGEHPHENETEYYIILEGKGVVCDNGVESEVAAGDIIVTPDGSNHSIRNTGDTDLRMIALIITY